MWRAAIEEFLAHLAMNSFNSMEPKWEADKRDPGEGRVRATAYQIGASYAGKSDPNTTSGSPLSETVGKCVRPQSPACDRGNRQPGPSSGTDARNVLLERVSRRRDFADLRPGSRHPRRRNP